MKAEEKEVWIRYNDFVKSICEDYNISSLTEDIFKLPSNKKDIKKFSSGRASKVKIVTKEGIFPFMIEHSQRNIEKLENGIELRCERTKTLSEVEKELGISLISKSVRISEGGGWTSEGTRYYYKNYYCEV